MENQRTEWQIWEIKTGGKRGKHGREVGRGRETKKPKKGKRRQINRRRRGRGVKAECSVDAGRERKAREGVERRDDREEGEDEKKVREKGNERGRK